MKKLGIALLGLIVLLLAAVFIAPSFVDWNAHKARVAEEVRKLTGRELTIGGDIHLALLPAPALSADEVSFANLEGASAPAMAELDSLEVRVALLPLIRGEIQVEQVVLVKPIIRLEVLPDGRKNWEFGAPGAAEPMPRAAGEAGMAAQVSLDDLRISDGTLIYRDAPAGREETIRDLDARIAAESLRGPFAVSGAAAVRAIATEFEFSLGRLPRDGATPLSVTVRLPGPGASLRFGGAMSLQPDGATLRGTLKAEGDSLADLASTLGDDAVAPGTLAQAFALSVELAANPAQVSAKDVVFRMGELALEGEAIVDLEPALDAQVRLSASRINLDKLLAGPSEATPADSAAGGDRAAEPAGPASAPAAPRLALPADVSGTLEVAVDALVYREQVVRQFLFSASLAQGAIRIEQALALLPGGSDVSITGTVAAPAADEGPPRFDGRVEAASDNLRGILDWFGTDVSGVPAERLRRASLSARIAGTPQQITIGDIDLSVDLSRATGGIAVALRDRIGLGIGLAVDKLDLDAYLPPDSRRAEPADARRDAAQATGQATDPPAGPGVLKAFDANLDLRLGALTARGTTARDLRLDATLQRGALTLREARVGDLAGSEVQLAGRVTGLAGEPAVDGTVALKSGDPARLAKLAGLEPGPLAKLGPLELTGSVKGGLGELALDAVLTALDGRLGAAGTVTAPGPAASFDVALEAEHPSLARLAGVFAPDLALRSELGGLDLSARVAGGPAEVRVSDLSGTLGPVTLSGTLGARLAGEAPGLAGYDLKLGLRHGDLAALSRAVNGPALDPALGGVDLSARVSGTATRVEVSDLAGKVGQTDLSGTVSADLAGARPALDIDLDTGPLPLAAVAAPGAAPGGGASERGTGGGATASTAAAPAGGERWSTKPIDLSALRALDANLKLRAQALLLDKVRVDNAVIEGALKDGILDLSKATGTAFGGAISGRGKLDARARPTAGVALTAIEVNTAALADALADSDRVSGPLNLEASLSTEGQSEAELIGALSGNGRLDGSITVKTKGEEQFGAALLDILGQKVKEVRGITDTTSTVFNAFGGRPAAVTGTFTVDRGIVRTSDLKATGRDATALTQGTASLPAWRIETRTDLFRAQDAATPYLTVNLSGPLDDPNVRLGGRVLQREPQAAPAQPAGPQPSGQDQPAPAPAPGLPEKIEPKEFLEKGLKGLLKGLQN